MKMPTHVKPIPALLLFIIGILFAFTLSILSAWADYEASSYGFPNRASTLLTGLNCPILMTRNETQTVSIKIANRTKLELSPSARIDISTAHDPITYNEIFYIATGDSRLLQWTIGPENIDYGRFIFANVLIYSTYPLPDRENTCGVFVLPIDGNGQLIFIFATIISILCIGSGAYFLQRSTLSSKHKRPALFLTPAIFLTMIVSFMGLWIQAILLIAITVLAIFTILSSLLS